MPNLIPYHLALDGGLHIGTRGVDLEDSSVVIPSDTLFSALAATWRRMGQPVDALLEAFVAEPPDPPYLLTSAFPRAGEVRFYPMPVNPRAIFRDETIRARGKALKRVQFLSEKLLKKAIKAKAVASA